MSTSEEQNQKVEDDVSTVLNTNISHVKKHKIRSRNTSHEIESPSPDVEEEIIPEMQTMDFKEKVDGWVTQHRKGNNPKEIQETLRDLLSEDKRKSDFTLLPKGRTRAFLLSMDPYPDVDPMNFLSGYCHTRCKKTSVFSSIQWEKVEDYDIPVCPDCFKLGLKKELKLLFLLQLYVMGRDGYHVYLHLLKDQAEIFFGCSAREFVTNTKVRKAIGDTMRKGLFDALSPVGKTPLMEFTIVPVKNLLCIVNSKLNLDEP